MKTQIFSTLFASGYTKNTQSLFPPRNAYRITYAQQKSLVYRYAAHCLWKAVQVAISAVRNKIYSIKISTFKKHRQSIEGCSNSYEPNNSTVRDISNLKL